MSVNATNGNVLLCVKVPIPKQRKTCITYWSDTVNSRTKMKKNLRYICKEKFSHEYVSKVLVTTM